MTKIDSDEHQIKCGSKDIYYGEIQGCTYPSRRDTRTPLWSLAWGRGPKVNAWSCLCPWAPVRVMEGY